MSIAWTAVRPLAVLLVAVCVFVAGFGLSQPEPCHAQPIDNPPPPIHAPMTGQDAAGEDQPQAFITYKTPYEFYLTAVTVALGVLMAGLLCLLSFRESVNTEILRAFLLVMIIFSALFLIVAGYSEKQTAPVFGLLGTVLGYMFGRAVTAEQAEITESKQGKTVPAAKEKVLVPKEKPAPKGNKTARRRNVG